MGTTELDTILDTNYQRLSPLGLVHEHHVDECSWTSVAKELANFAGMPQFVIDSQLFCKWIRAGGGVFQNIECRELSQLELQLLTPMKYYGLDPNPKSGHALVRTRIYRPADPAKIGFIYVEDEIDSHILEDRFKRDPKSIKSITDYIFTKYGVQFKIDGEPDDTLLMALQLWAYSTTNSQIEIEENNGQEFLKTLWRITGKKFLGRVGVMCWTEDVKAHRIFGIRQYKIIVNPKCKQTWHHLKTAVWNPKDPSAKLLKSPDQHYLDGFIHSCAFVGQTSIGLMHKT
jgi:hypothetical protein